MADRRVAGRFFFVAIELNPMALILQGHRRQCRCRLGHFWGGRGRGVATRNIGVALFVHFTNKLTSDQGKALQPPF